MVEVAGLVLWITAALLVLVHAGDDWNYFGANDQFNWGATHGLCDSGKRQSPIDIVGMDTIYDSTLTSPLFEYVKQPTDKIHMYNDGKKVGAAFEGDIHVTGAGLNGTYKVHGAHWHWGRRDYKGSEHLYSGRSYPLEVHVVTYSDRYHNVTEAVTKGDLNALAVFGTVYQITEETECPALNKLFAAFDKLRNPDKTNKVEIEAFNYVDIMSRDTSNYFRYYGSLTTPGCQEKVIWTNFVMPVHISSDQMERFRTLSAHDTGFFHIGDNYREPQPLNGRRVRRSFKNIRPGPNCNVETYSYDFDSATSASISVILLAAVLALQIF